MSGPEKDILTIKVGEAVRMDSECPLCWLLEKSEANYLETFYTQCVMDPWYREKIIRSRGFCRHHFHRLLDYAVNHYEKLGLALILENLVETRLKDLKELSILNSKRPPGSKGFFPIDRASKPGKKAVSKFLFQAGMMTIDSAATCPICESLQESDARYVDAFTRLLSTDEGFQKEFMQSKGVCLFHLFKLLEAEELNYRQSLPSLPEKLLALEVKNLSRLGSEIKELIRKHDYRFHDEPWGSEIDVVERAVPKLIGTLQLGSTKMKVM